MKLGKNVLFTRMNNPKSPCNFFKVEGCFLGNEILGVDKGIIIFPFPKHLFTNMIYVDFSF